MFASAVRSPEDSGTVSGPVALANVSRCGGAMAFAASVRA